MFCEIRGRSARRLQQRGKGGSNADAAVQSGTLTPVWRESLSSLHSHKTSLEVGTGDPFADCWEKRVSSPAGALMVIAAELLSDLLSSTFDAFGDLSAYTVALLA